MMSSLLEPWAAVRLASQAGFNAVCIDCEHGCATTQMIEPAGALAAAIGMSLFVRVRSRADVGVVLDCGAHGIVCSHVQTPDEARSWGKLAKYPPLGGRALSSTRLHRRFSDGSLSEKIIKANEQTLVFVTIETPSGLRALDEIAAIQQVDGLIVGPLDLSTELGHPGDVLHPNIVRAHQEVADSCRANGKQFGAFLSGELMSSPVASLNPDLILAGTDSSYLLASASADVRMIRDCQNKVSLTSDLGANLHLNGGDR
jgi:4-hydroxy-2-oxoheptanedioate aldolase